ncbi:hypothetical protein [Microtetraspora glauca]|uniref:Uncharacterized protein n=1 Tax=Microtetraspora glauca TaxID=1996 RepID=A0ABV3GK84_MICGL
MCSPILLPIRAYDRARYALDRHPATRLVSFVAAVHDDLDR